MDICNAQDIRLIIEDFEPQWVINCAAFTQVDLCEQERDRCWQINVQGVEYLANACRRIGARLLQVSTDFVFDGSLEMYQENDRPNPLSFYGKSKLAGENAARKAGIDLWCVVRTSVVFGVAVQRAREDFVGWVRNRLGGNSPILAFTDQWRTPTYSYDLAKGIMQLVQRGATGVFHLTGRDYVTMFNFAQTVAETFSLDRTLVQPASQPMIPMKAQRPVRSGLIIIKAESEVGYRPMRLKSALLHLKQHQPAA